MNFFQSKTETISHAFFHVTYNNFHITIFFKIFSLKELFVSNSYDKQQQRSRMTSEMITKNKFMKSFVGPSRNVFLANK